MSRHSIKWSGDDSVGLIGVMSVVVEGSMRGTMDDIDDFEQGLPPQNRKPVVRNGILARPRSTRSQGWSL